MDRDQTVVLRALKRGCTRMRASRMRRLRNHPPPPFKTRIPSRNRSFPKKKKKTNPQIPPPRSRLYTMEPAAARSHSSAEHRSDTVSSCALPADGRCCCCCCCSEASERELLVLLVLLLNILGLVEREEGEGRGARPSTVRKRALRSTNRGR